MELYKTRYDGQAQLVYDSLPYYCSEHPIPGRFTITVLNDISIVLYGATSLISTSEYYENLWLIGITKCNKSGCLRVLAPYNKSREKKFTSNGELIEGQHSAEVTDLEAEKAYIHLFTNNLLNKDGTFKIFKGQ